jgi:hypothetical protein
VPESQITFRDFEPKDLKVIVPDVAPGWAEVSKQSGPAITAVLNDEILMCGGIRIAGIGEAWSAYSDKAKQNYRKAMLAITRDYMKRVVDENKLWRLVASNKDGVPETFLEHLGFVKTHNGLYVNENCVRK